MKKLLILIVIALIAGCKKEQEKPIICQGASAYWAESKEQCAADEGNWVDETGANCSNIKKTGKVCCVGCTSDSMEEMGVD